jgi:CBS domain-containing protein/sporulation protein YlmC with PRC-barrel domain
MPYISQLIGRIVTDLDGEHVGNLKDILAAQKGSIPHPQIVAIQVKRRGEEFYIPISDVAALVAPAIPLNKRQKDMIPCQPDPTDLYLVRDVLDKQIIDTNGLRVVRVNDLEYSRVEEILYLTNVDISGAGLLRRLGMDSLARRISSRSRPAGLPGIISWDNVELISSDQPMRLKVPGERMSELHPADLAEILSDLSRQDGTKLLESLDDEALADALEEVEPDFQASLVEEIPDERLADVLEEMDPDEAADLLAELPEERSQELLRLMDQEEAEDVIKLLGYPEDSAGGIMNTDYFAVTAEMTAGEVVSMLRQTAQEFETVFYIYVLSSEDRLVGVFSLRELILAQPGTPVTEFMEDRVVTIKLSDSQEECAQAIAKYNLLAIPVIDEQGRMHGIVTADDALDKIIPTAWKKRLPRFYR